MRIAIGLIVVMACGDSSSTPPDSAVADAPMADAAEPELTAEQMAQLAELSPLPSPPSDPTNAYADSAAAAKLGQMLFFDKSYSGPLAVGDSGTNGGLGAMGETGKVSCASCHAVGSESLDDRRSQPGATSLGTALGGRNALGAVNSAFYRWTNWGGRFDSQWSLPLAVAEGGATMASTRLAVAHMLYAKYRTEYDAVFPVPLDADLDPNAANASRFPATGKPGQPAFDNMAAADKDIINRIYANYGKALAAYMRTLVSRNAPLDRFIAGDANAISSAAKRGAKLFLTKGCVGCHAGPNFSDDSFHALLAPDAPAAATPDLGRYTDVTGLLASPFNTDGAYSDDTTTGKLASLTQMDTMKGQFRTKSLRNIAQSAPYMHAGQLATLEDVIDFYDAGGGDPGSTGITKDPLMKPLGLSSADKADLVEFMKTLTGEPLPAAVVVDISK